MWASYLDFADVLAYAFYVYQRFITYSDDIFLKNANAWWANHMWIHLLHRLTVWLVLRKVTITAVR
jgi:hypothetical protein